MHVVLVNYNGWRDTLECLESLFRLDYPDFRVIVCDNGSENDSLARIVEWAEGRLATEPAENEELRHLSSPPVAKPIPYRVYDRGTAERGGVRTSQHDARLILIQTGENLGFAGGNNVGLRYLEARGEMGCVWLLNNDTVVAPDALTRLVEVAERDATIGVVGARLFHYTSPDAVQAAGGGRIRWNGVGCLLTDDHANGAGNGRPPRIDYVTGASMLIPLRALSTVGLMEESYFAYSEEADWCLAMRARGLRIGYAPRARVWHKEGRTLGCKSPFRDYLIERNALLLVRKYFTPRMPLAIAYSLYRSFLPKLVRGEWSRLAAVARAYRDFALHVWRARTGDTNGAAPLAGREVQPKAS